MPAHQTPRRRDDPEERAWPPHVQPLHIAYVADGGPRGTVLTHLARPNPIWPALEARPEVVVSVVDDYAYVPGPWQAAPDDPTEHGVPTSIYAAVQLHCTAHLVDDPAEKAALLNRQAAHFQPDGGTAPAAPGEAPFGRQLAGIRGLRLDITDVRAKFKYAGHRAQERRDRIAAGLAERGTGRDPRPCRQTPACPTTPGTHARGVAESPTWLRHEDAPAPCDRRTRLPHSRPRSSGRYPRRGPPSGRTPGPSGG